MIPMLALMLALQGFSMSGGAVMVVYSDVNGQQWKSVALAPDVDSTQPWHASDAATPLSPNAAILAASVVMRGIVPNPDEWSVRSAALVPLGQTPRAIYVVEFNESKAGIMMSGRVQALTIFVLMNGTAIRPLPTHDNLSIPEVRNPN